jgi:hypothetical protein
MGINTSLISIYQKLLKSFLEFTVAESVIIGHKNIQLKKAQANKKSRFKKVISH